MYLLLYQLPNAFLLFSACENTPSLFYQHSAEVFTDSSAVLLRKLRDLESDFLKQLIMFMLISSFVTNLQNICGRGRINPREGVVRTRTRIGRKSRNLYNYFRILPISRKLLHVHVRNVEDSVKLCKILSELVLVLTIRSLRLPPLLWKLLCVELMHW